MLNRFFGKNFHDNFHLFGISAFAIGLPSSKVILSLATMLLLLNLLLEGSFKTYWQNIKNNRLFLGLALFWSLHIIALLWTTDFAYAANDIRIKLTLLLIPLVLTIKPILSKRNLKFILLLFVATLAVISFFNFASYQHWIGNRSYSDIRELSLFGSHIRFGILIAVGAGISLFYIRILKSSVKWILLLIFFWFCYYTYYSQIISGLLALVVMLFVFIVFQSFNYSKKVGWITVVFFTVLFVTPFLMLYIDSKKESNVDYSNLEEYTPYGNKYTHFLDESTFVDGEPLFAYLCEKELIEAWNKSSTIHYDSLDNKGQPLHFTLIRYMTSKGLKKDGKDFLKLSKRDIQFIENGIANVDETHSGLAARWEGIKFQLNHPLDPNGHSLLQRLEYWKTGWQIIQKNWIFGVGTGDVQLAFNQQYEQNQTPLFPKNRLRAHNSYLTSWISFGVFGLILFLWMNLSFLATHLKNRDFIPIMFIAIALSTFLIEDTLETQMGVSFFAFFYGLFITPKKEGMI